MLLQEYITDCFTSFARHFRISTVSLNNTISLFSIDEKKQDDMSKVASNHVNGGSLTFCPDNKCDFLTDTENMYIHDITRQLFLLHKNRFKNVPFIGWDVCLTCKGPYVFEGNLGGSVEWNHEKYINIMEQVYNGTSNK